MIMTINNCYYFVLKNLHYNARLLVYGVLMGCTVKLNRHGKHMHYMKWITIEEYYTSLNASTFQIPFVIVYPGDNS